MRRNIAVLLVLLVALVGCSGRVKPDGKAKEKPKPAPEVVKAEPQPNPILYDLVIRGGQILDGSGRPAFPGDLAIIGDRVVAVGVLPTHRAVREIDARGLVVAPGFINPHSHTHDRPLNPFDDWDATASLMQGITTELGGVDGRSPVDIGAELTRIAKLGTGVNFGLFVGQGSIRGQVVGSGPGAATPQQVETMRAKVRQAMQDGAFGLSTGLEYPPGRYADAAEIAALVAETRPFGGVYSTHLRSEGDRIIEALQEAIQIARTAGVALNLSHFKIVKPANWGKLDAVIALIEKARQDGMTIFADVYPYLAPDYAVNRPLSEWLGMPPEALVITVSRTPGLVGKSLAAVAAELGLRPADAAQRLMAEDTSLRVVALVSSEEAMLQYYRQPWSVVSTDGEAQPRLENPADALGYFYHRRSYGSYPLLLGHYVRERRLMPLEQMVHKMSGAVAQYLGVKERGFLRPGYFADLVIFNPAEVADRTTWLQPQEYPVGILHVFVNGVQAVENGKRLEGRPGRVLRRSE